MGSPGLAMGAEPQRGEGLSPEKQGMGGRCEGHELDLGARRHDHSWSRTHFDPMRVGRVRVTPTLGDFYISKFYAFDLRQFAI